MSFVGTSTVVKYDQSALVAWIFPKILKYVHMYKPIFARACPVESEKFVGFVSTAKIVFVFVFA